MKENVGTPASGMSTNICQEDSLIQSEALFCSLTFMKQITKEEQDEINYTDNDGNNVITICDYPIICSHHFATLHPQVWLNDEIIHYFLLHIEDKR